MSNEVLVLADSPIYGEGIEAVLRDDGQFAVVNRYASVDAYLGIRAFTQPDVIIVQTGLPAEYVAHGVTSLKSSHSDAPVVIIAVEGGLAQDNLFLATLRAGASGFVEADAGPKQLLRVIRKVAEGLVAGPDALFQRLAEESGGPRSSAVPRLTRRESEVIKLLAQGLSNVQVADKLGLSMSTAATHVQNLMTKLGAESRAQAVARAVTAGLLELRDFKASDGEVWEKGSSGQTGVTYEGTA